MKPFHIQEMLERGFHDKKREKWRKIYLAFLIFVYGIFIPVELYEFITGGGRFPIAVVIVGGGYPFMRYNHLKKIREEEQKS